MFRLNYSNVLISIPSTDDNNVLVTIICHALGNTRAYKPISANKDNNILQLKKHCKIAHDMFDTDKDLYNGVLDDEILIEDKHLSIYKPKAGSKKGSLPDDTTLDKLCKIKNKLTLHLTVQPRSRFTLIPSVKYVEPKDKSPFDMKVIYYAEGLTKEFTVNKCTPDTTLKKLVESRGILDYNDVYFMIDQPRVVKFDYFSKDCKLGMLMGKDFNNSIYVFTSIETKIEKAN